MSLTLFLIGLISGVVTGLLSIGGGIILISFLIIIPPLILKETFTMQTIAGFAMLLAFFSTLSGSIYYWRARLIERNVVLFLGVPSFFGAMLGSFLSEYTPEKILKIIFIILAVGAVIILQISQNPNHADQRFRFQPYSAVLTVGAGIVIGGIGGLIGLAAGFIYVPFMTYFFKFPIKKAIGSSLNTCFLLACGGLAIKFGVHSIALGLGFSLVLGGIIGAQLGGIIGKFLSPLILKEVATLLISLICIKLIYDLFQL
ncbi:putative membrane protein YfcA [Caldalkalibacillus uzonensis]|uniref:Probable membrane transporter protein n=1 Tax=Caldalkalibacillus uzonensis TaxID=353224 RepID=A0ABU0CPY1_9BACI|nr:sulfite exporter TauE/SafE family protein [Caldalkalibacillus uzonensis]MDQ0337966.1 putative membrane protein YfcA [Caldalkalibacillus uzonensis]